MNRFGVVLLMAGILAGCASSCTDDALRGDDVRDPSNYSHPVPVSTTVLVFGAASLRNVLEDLRTAYTELRPEVAIELSTDASSTLTTQLLEGAPADVFLSADDVHPQRLIDANLADGPATPFASNELVIVTPADDTTLASPLDLARPGVRIIAAGDAVPITRYASELVAGLARESGYPDDFVAAYAANTVSREDNVQAVLTKIALGEGDAGIVYRTDALGSPAVRSIGVPPSVTVRAAYTGVVMADSAEPEAARSFLAWLTGPEAQGLLADAGFLPPGP